MKELKGTKTEKNLQEAFAGESQARNKYTYFASNANSTSKCKITKCFCKSTPLVLRNSISFLVSH